MINRADRLPESHSEVVLESGKINWLAEEAKRTIRYGEVIRCDSDLNLTIRIDDFTKGMMAFEDIDYREDRTLSKASVMRKVGNKICFCVKEVDSEGIIWLSRKEAQGIYLEEILNEKEPGDLFNGCIYGMIEYGCFVDIGCGVEAFLPAEKISLSRADDTESIMSYDQEIKVIFCGAEGYNILVTHKELLGDWAHCTKEFNSGDVAVGVVRYISPTAMFIELAPNVTGIADEVEGVEVGSVVSVYIRSVALNEVKMKCRVKNVFPKDGRLRYRRYYEYTDAGLEGIVRNNKGEVIHAEAWTYSPPGNNKEIRTVFSELGDKEKQRGYKKDRL